MTGRLLTARQVADTLGVSAETVLRWTRRGELPAIRLPGGAIRYRPDDLDGWLEQRATGATGRGDVSHHDGRAQTESYAGLRSFASVTTPPDAATIEEDS